jgi:hypothetical protein
MSSVFREQPDPDPSRADAPVHAVAGESASFARDSLVWSLGRLAERAIRQYFRQPQSSDRYRQCLASFAGDDPESPNTEQFTLMCLGLGADGQLTLTALPTHGQFLLSIEHGRFQAVVAIAYASPGAGKQPDGVCLAHFEGDAALATRWSLGVNTWLRLRWNLESRNPARGAALN